MRVVYAVEWLEIDFGQRPEGYILYNHLEQCKALTKNASARGPCGGDEPGYRGPAYCGPARPLCYYEVPFDSLEEEYQKRLNKRHICSTSNYWKPKFKSSPQDIK